MFLVSMRKIFFKINIYWLLCTYYTQYIDFIGYFLRFCLYFDNQYGEEKWYFSILFDKNKIFLSLYLLNISVLFDYFLKKL